GEGGPAIGGARPGAERGVRGDGAGAWQGERIEPRNTRTTRKEVRRGALWSAAIHRSSWLSLAGRKRSKSGDESPHSRSLRFPFVWFVCFVVPSLLTPGSCSAGTPRWSSSCACG